MSWYDRDGFACARFEASLSGLVMLRWLIPLFLCTLVSCGGREARSSHEVGSAAAPLITFPDRGDLATYLDEPIELRPLLDDEPMGAWSFETDRASGVAPWDETLAHLKAEYPHLRTGDDLNCAARELGRAYGKYARLGDHRFRRHVAARCGVGLASLQVIADTQPVPVRVGEAELWSKMRQRGVDAFLRKAIESGMDALGMSVVRDGESVTWSVVGGQELARLRDAAPGPNAEGNVTIEGRLAKPVEQLGVLINHGESAMRDCALRFAPPTFRAVCPMAPQDDSAWFEVVSREREAVLSSVVARGLAHRGPLNRKYAPPPSAARVSSPDRFVTDLFSELNVRRADARLPALVLNAEQSAESAQLTPHLLAAQRTGDREATEQITLGLLAGWQVSGEIRSGSIFVMDYPDRSAARWLGEALESPLGRSVLLDPAARVVSVGSAFSGDRSTAVVVNTYELFESEDHSRDAAYAFAVLNRARSAAGRSMASWVSDLHELDTAAGEVRRGMMSPADAVGRAAREVAQSLRRPVWGLALEAYELDHLRFPDELVRAPTLFASIAVTHRKPVGAAWAQLVVLVLLIAEETA